MKLKRMKGISDLELSCRYRCKDQDPSPWFFSRKWRAENARKCVKMVWEVKKTNPNE